MEEKFVRDIRKEIIVCFFLIVFAFVVIVIKNANIEFKFTRSNNEFELIEAEYAMLYSNIYYDRNNEDVVRKLTENTKTLKRVSNYLSENYPRATVLLDNILSNNKSYFVYKMEGDAINPERITIRIENDKEVVIQGSTYELSRSSMSYYKSSYIDQERLKKIIQEYFKKEKYSNNKYKYKDIEKQKATCRLEKYGYYRVVWNVKLDDLRIIIDAETGEIIRTETIDTY